MNLKRMERYLPVNLLWPGPRLIKKEFTGPRSHKVWETLIYTTTIIAVDLFSCYSLQYVQKTDMCRTLRNNKKRNVETLPDLRNSYVPGGPAWDWVSSSIERFQQKSSLSYTGTWNFSVIAQQYSSVTFLSCFQSGTEKFGALFKKAIFF